MKTLKIDLDDLIMALASRFELDDPSHYLDRHTGEVIYAGEGLEQLPADLSSDPRYQWIDPASADQLLAIMEAFIAGVEPPQAKVQLRAAWEDNEPFEAFSESMQAWPELRNVWVTYQQQALTDLAQAWCVQHGIEPQWL